MTTGLTRAIFIEKLDSNRIVEGCCCFYPSLLNNSPLMKMSYICSVSKGLSIGAIVKPWSESNTKVWLALAPRDFLADYTSAVQTVLASGAKVLIYAGDQDFISL
mmetsp:Transcript_27551/g.23613  ORF Transcript_27551/g.23613 Transcript_27551/m.23613 type:complete len:105 (+) Transcript_27551:6-320(+)